MAAVIALQPPQVAGPNADVLEACALLNKAVQRLESAAKSIERERAPYPGQVKSKTDRVAASLAVKVQRLALDVKLLYDRVKSEDELGAAAQTFWQQKSGQDTLELRFERDRLLKEYGVEGHVETYLPIAATTPTEKHLVELALDVYKATKQKRSAR